MDIVISIVMGYTIISMSIGFIMFLVGLWHDIMVYSGKALKDEYGYHINSSFFWYMILLISCPVVHLYKLGRLIIKGTVL